MITVTAIEFFRYLFGLSSRIDPPLVFNRYFKLGVLYMTANPQLCGR